MNIIRSAICTTSFYTWAIILGILMLPMLILPRPFFQEFVILWATGNSVIFRFIVGVKIEIKGREFIPNHPVIIASKHQSEWETNIFLHLLNDPAYIMKKELAYIPGYGIYARKMNMIFIDRSGHAKSLRKLVQDARNAIERGRSLVIFPEGTRVDPGKKLPYRPGIAALYKELSVPVVPVVHNSGLCWPKNSFRKYPGTITLQFLPPIHPGLRRNEFMKQLESTMELASIQLIANTENLSAEHN